MTTLRIEHPVPDFDGWKKAFDNDPVHRKQSGVRRYRILRPTDNPNFVTVDLDFDDNSDAEAFLGALQGIWRRVDRRGAPIGYPQR